jgi:NAD(P)-dependent dehydrogenase (short-subunit alcohol dehydrogenase family)
MKLDNKIAVITGGNSGIGQGIAKCFIYKFDLRLPLRMLKQ